jgi:hypothetical protein
MQLFCCHEAFNLRTVVGRCAAADGHQPLHDLVPHRRVENDLVLHACPGALLQTAINRNMARGVVIADKLGKRTTEEEDEEARQAAVRDSQAIKYMRYAAAEMTRCCIQ